MAQTRAAARAAARNTKDTPLEGAPRPPKSFTVSRLREEDFATGLRRYAQYRDLGLAKATHGKVQAHVIRFVPPCNPDEVSKLHLHDVELQMIYVLKGWIKTELEGEGAHVMRAGSWWVQEPTIRTKVLADYGDCDR